MYNKNETFILYLVIIFLIASCLTALPFLSTPISIKSSGIIRPVLERTHIRATQTGIIDTVFFKEGDHILIDNTLLKIRDKITGPKVSFSNSEADRIFQFVQDLHLLTSNFPILPASPIGLRTPLYKEQLNKYLNRLAEQKGVLEKAEKEYDLYGRLWKEKVISEKEYFDYNNAKERAQASYEAFNREQKSNGIKKCLTIRAN